MTGERMTPKQRVERDFTYYPPSEWKAEVHAEMREAIKDLALYIVEKTVESREQSLALTNLEQVMFWANAAIARNV